MVHKRTREQPHRRLRVTRAGPRSCAGLTLIELLVTFAIASLLLSLAGPSFVQMIQRKRAVANAEDVLNLVREAQQGAMSSNLWTMMHFQNTGTTSCQFAWNTQIAFGPFCGCSTTPVCYSGMPDVSYVLSNRRQDASDGLSIQAFSAAGLPLRDAYLMFEHRNGVPSAVTGYQPSLAILVTTRGGGSLRVNVSKGGVINMCSVEGTHVPYPKC